MVNTSLRRIIFNCVNWPRGVSNHGMKTSERENVRSLGAYPLNNVFPVLGGDRGLDRNPELEMFQG